MTTPRNFIKRLLDGLAWLIASVAVLAWVAFMVVMIVKEPWAILVIGAFAAIGWAGSRLLGKL